MAGEPYNEILYKAAEKTIAGSGGTAADPSVVVGNVAHDTVDSGAPIKIGAKAESTIPAAVADGDRVDVWASTLGAVAMFPVDYANGFQARVTVAANGDVNNYGLIVNSREQVWAGASNWVLKACAALSSRLPSSANTVNATLVKNGAGNLFQVNGYNSSATVTYLKIYNKATAPTVGTDTPVLTFALPPTATFSYAIDQFYCSTGIGFGLTTDAADAGTTAVAAGAILGLNVVYS